MNELSSSFNLTGRRALVTGSSRGIGAAIALGLAEAGADVAVHYSGNEAAARAVHDQIIAIGRRATLVQGSFAEADSPRKVFEQVTAALGGLDILVSNVAVQHAEPWGKVSRKNFDEQVVINWRSAFELIQQAAPAMMERKWGRILTIGSVQELIPHPQMVVYSSLKAAQTLMVKNLAAQFAANGVTVNNLAPGVIATDRNSNRLNESDYKAKVLSKIPVGFLGEAKDCAGAALLLCSNAGRYITGQNLFVDGGMGI